MEQIKKLMLIILLIITGVFFFLINLHKGTIGTEFDIFAPINILITALIFIIGVPVLIAIQKFINKNNRDKGP